MKDEFEPAFYQTSKKKRTRSRAPWYYVGLVGDIGFAIALPIAGGALTGVFVDRLWSTTPKATLSLLFVGIMLSCMNVLRTLTIIKEN